MSKRTMIVQPDVIEIDGDAWSRELPSLVIKQYDNGNVVRQVKVPLRPVDIQDFANALWKLHEKFQAQADCIMNSLNRSV